MATTRSLGFYFAIFTVLSIFVDTNCQTPLSENDSSEGTCFSSNSQVDVKMEPFFKYDLRWKKPNREGLIEYRICMSVQEYNIIKNETTFLDEKCEFYTSSADCPSFTMNTYMIGDLFQFFVYVPEPYKYGYWLRSSQFNRTEIIDGCKVRGDVNVFNITETSAIVQWEKPKNCNYMYMLYTVNKNRQLRTGWYVPEGGYELSNFFNITTVTENNLIPGSKYEFRLDVSFQSNRIQRISSPYIRIKHPLDSKIDSYLSKRSNSIDHDELIKVLDFTDTTVNIQWSKPEKISTAAKMDVFIIESSQTKELELVDDVYSYGLENYVYRIKYLKPGRNYKFLVAYTDGEDVYFLISKEIITDNPSVKPNKIPGSLDYSYNNTTETIMFKWNKPVNSPTTVNYKLKVGYGFYRSIYNSSEHPTYTMSASQLPNEFEARLYACNILNCSPSVNITISKM
ncbi:uncharacterized protein LOC127283921 isoform X2 [Leptopilina boulardi]|uniref:uncharacterized protein LOC127283921 isoform X2 n=1 Tax=Leptopilina boulardi TaxID=63433 RepID=UPI0021F5AE97|nr:uncharacterized protein LOC127283921 isoform X2 [Leptopilina boulardi]